MRLEEQIRNAELALAGLRSAAEGAEGWSELSRFETTRLRPLTDSGKQLLSALQKVQRQYESAARLMPDPRLKT